MQLNRAVPRVQKHDRGDSLESKGGSASATGGGGSLQCWCADIEAVSLEAAGQGMVLLGSICARALEAASALGAACRPHGYGDHLGPAASTVRQLRGARAAEETAMHSHVNKGLAVIATRAATFPTRPDQTRFVAACHARACLLGLRSHPQSTLPCLPANPRNTVSAQRRLLVPCTCGVLLPEARTSTKDQARSGAVSSLPV